MTTIGGNEAAARMDLIPRKEEFAFSSSNTRLQPTLNEFALPYANDELEPRMLGEEAIRYGGDLAAALGKMKRPWSPWGERAR